MNIRKRVAAFSVVVLASGTGLFLAVNSAAAARAGAMHLGLRRFAFNGAASASISHRSAPSCRFTNDRGIPVSSIKIDRLTGSDKVYWMEYNSNGLRSTRITFTLVGPFGSNQIKQSQRFNVASTPTTSIITPFGIPFWANNTTSGKWTLTVESNTEATVTCTVSAS